MLKEIKEFFWPVLEGETSSPAPLSEDICKCKPCELDDLIKIAKDYYASEENRKKEVENKASLFIGTFSVATTIMLSLVRDFIKDKNTFIFFINSVLVTITIIYLCKAISFSIKCLSRRKYWTLGFPNYLWTANPSDEKKRKILIELVNDSLMNSKVINEKVDNMVMAQMFFKRAVVSLAGLTLILFIEAIIKNYKGFIVLNDELIFKIIVIVFLIILLVGEITLFNRTDYREK